MFAMSIVILVSEIFVKDRQFWIYGIIRKKKIAILRLMVIVLSLRRSCANCFHGIRKWGNTYGNQGNYGCRYRI